MSLTLGTGPLAGTPGGTFNFDLDGAAPAHPIFFADHPVRIRAVVAGETIVDTVGAKLLYERGISAVLYVPVADLAPELIEKTETSTHCPFKGDASYWTLKVGDRVETDAIWAYESPKPESSWLQGYAALYWDRVDALYIEDERVYGHFRDPYHRVDVHGTSRPVEVRVGGEVIATSDRAKLVMETGLPPRPYLPTIDLPAGMLSPSETRSICPYKGEATYWHVTLADGRVLEDAAWSYESPLPEALKAQGHVSFWGEGVEVAI